MFSLNLPPKGPRPPQRPPQPRGKPIWKSPLAWTVVVLLAVAALLVAASRVWTEILWYRQIGFLSVFTTMWGSRIILFLVGGLIMAALIWQAMYIALKTKPIYVPTTAAEQAAAKYREMFDPLKRPALIGVPLLLGLFAGASAQGHWSEVLLALNSHSFGQTDPLFGQDVSFYVFLLPVLRFGVSFLMSAVALSLVVALAVQYLYGGINVTASPGTRVSKAARRQLGITAAVFCVLVAGQYWLDRYSMLNQQRELFDGAGYTAVHATIPAKALMAVIALFVAAMFLIASWKGDWKLPAIGLGLMVLAFVAVGWAYPALIQKFSVDPSAQTKEAPYIQRNIDATRDAFGIVNVEVQDYSAKTNAEKGALREDADSTASIRLLDPTVVSPTFRQKQQNKQYYDFPDFLAVDRYSIDGEMRDTVIAVRDLKVTALGDNATWVNQHTVYTHGYGVAAAYGNTTDSQGWPLFFEGDIPAQGELKVEEPRVYFGTTSPDYSIVGGPEGWEDVEFDYPSDAEGDTARQVNTTFVGDGGPNVGNPLNKLLFALRFGSTNILFSSNVNPESQILFDRDPVIRVKKVAPYLTPDERTYPAVVDGRIVWIVDAYTTSAYYPYSQHQVLSTATRDSLTARGGGIAGINLMGGEQVNYIRNSVKAVVDAYDGKVTLYAWDEEDPVLKAWSAVYNNTLEPIDSISGDLMAHLRYPESLFKVQRTVLERYHVTDATTFYGGQDFWKVPNDPTKAPDNIQQPPYYLTLRMPDQAHATFSLSTSYIPAGGGADDRPILKGFLAVDSETGNTPGKVAEGYGKMRLLQLPQGTSIAGPGQVQNTFDSDANVKTQMRLLQDQGTEVVKGNLLTLPMGGGLLYVQPMYVQASGGTKFPSLQKVVVGFGEKVGVANTLDEALDAVFGGDSGAKAGDSDVTKELGIDGTEGTDGPTGDDGATASPSPSPTPTEPPAGTGAVDLDQALADAQKALDDADAAIKAGDWAAYGRAQDALRQALEQAQAARNAGKS